MLPFEWAVCVDFREFILPETMQFDSVIVVVASVKPFDYLLPVSRGRVEMFFKRRPVVLDAVNRCTDGLILILHLHTMGLD